MTLTPSVLSQLASRYMSASDVPQSASARIGDVLLAPATHGDMSGTAGESCPHFCDDDSKQSGAQMFDMTLHDEAFEAQMKSPQRNTETEMPTFMADSSTPSTAPRAISKAKNKSKGAPKVKTKYDLERIQGTRGLQGPHVTATTSR